MAIYGAIRHAANKTGFNVGDVLSLKINPQKRLTVIDVDGFKVYVKDDLNKMGLYVMSHAVKLVSPAIDQQQTVSWWAD